ncbi:ATP-binding protein [Luteimonas kalidii]|uniref:AAA family ATPase n=1 Tax=Luteimonas kalidii TaxID=3042025 RepID=A0ABT6JUF9_9GAMM|nr:AAA family ATPase [Luteimonas kalidii]MDH5834242.1 AAA family ATPase [Luteimonas kalidii]
MRPVESPRDAVARLARSQISAGYEIEALHEYADASGDIGFYRARLRNPVTGDKVIRPVRRDGTRFVLGEPKSPASGKLLYRLREILSAAPDRIVWVVEGEKCADALAGCGAVATTSGSASSARGADWSPLACRRVRVWPDNDEPGAQYAEEVASALRELGCVVEIVDVSGYELPPHGDVVDLFEMVGECARDLGWLESAAIPLLPAPEEPEPDPWAATASDRFSVEELTSEPPATRWTLKPLLPTGLACVLTGAGGAGKTGFLAKLCIHICAGLRFGSDWPEQGSVLYVSAEDRRDVIRKHVWANAQGLEPEQLELVARHFIVKDMVGVGFMLTRHVNGQTEVAQDLDRLVEYAKGIPDLRLVVFDTLSRLNGGEENNEDLARIVSAMERVSRQTGTTTLVAHHTGKQQHRDNVVDQYSGRGGSSLSDNGRSNMHLALVKPGDEGCPSNAADLVAEKRLLRLSLVKVNGVPPGQPDFYLERVITPHAARLQLFEPEFPKTDMQSAWEVLREWFATQSEVQFPTSTTVDDLPEKYGPRNRRRAALRWAQDRGLLLEQPHPHPRGRKKTFLALPGPAASAERYREAAGGH